jgi:diacylglycerol O-acyltransferase
VRSKKVKKINLNNVDLAWLRMDNSTNPMMITVVLQFHGSIDFDRLSATLKDHLLRYRRFRQRVVQPRQILSRPYWDEDPTFRVEDHIEHLYLQPPADDTALEALINTKMNTALDFSHPLWNVSIVDNHPEGSIIICQVHHCIADGISLMHILSRMTQKSPDDALAHAIGIDPNKDAHNVMHGSPAVHPAHQGSEDSQAPATTAKTKPIDLTTKPSRGIFYRNPKIHEIIAASARIIFRPPDPPTILKGRLGNEKKAVWSEPLSMPELRKIAHFHHATINDVLMGIASGAIRRYMDGHNDHRIRDIRAFILVNMRGHQFDEELGNKFGLVFLKLPLARIQPTARLESIKRGMDSLKASAEYAASYLILNILGMLPEWIEDLAIMILDTKGTVVATNVPGPRHTIYLAGVPIRSIEAFVPQAGRIGVGLSFISYNGQVVVGFNADLGLVPDPENFIYLFHEEYKSFQSVLSEVALD